MAVTVAGKTDAAIVPMRALAEDDTGMAMMMRKPVIRMAIAGRGRQSGCGNDKQSTSQNTQEHGGSLRKFGR
jgi:hypothetical protein